MDLTNITYTGPEIDDSEIFAQVPKALASLLEEVNGFILAGGALHLRGACQNPAWHSLRSAWEGPLAIHVLYAAVDKGDVPFGQDCVGDQFLLREGNVYLLSAETGELDSLDLSFEAFMGLVQNRKLDVLQAEPLHQLISEGQLLDPGYLILAYPPFCTAEAAQGVSLRPVPAQELLQFHASLAGQIGGLDEGKKFEIKVVE